ncbi:uracil-DNA glycosylase [Burkholderia glumae]|uniref:Uracil-DNA glycosylase n=1 Tax=Burkholderia glumae TaxID=337 RepID=A0AAP9Y3P8_BURGL|nr:uracil-DNA glycosylase [Burkholderia glumae]ACR28797.1 phage SPO1 DNA polymerase-like protein [Burkholderia glumae BGR1]AJY67638.1 uracil DNA glycosylase superfamily protein [Burkholderia glumae LMG 2196 = ATCC 33617]KHJ59729.1 2-hydroxyacid dehydrogenase [Burkholderia glumae]MCM2483328.1 uracil-DNA glycosylase [Burkholderia glumae]MCM2506645.1 uracil-DNA glycosylase [Burkholderia glumae]
MSEPLLPAADPDLPATLDACRRCELWASASRPVAGAGPRRAAIMLVGEQPDAQDDRSGQPFSGTAGRLLDRALTEASLARSETYATYALKHLRRDAAGRPRADEAPAGHELDACRYWLEREIRSVAPRVIVAFGTAALRAVLDDPQAAVHRMPLPYRLPGGERVIATLAPAQVLRTRGADSRERAWQQIVKALRAARRIAQAADETAEPATSASSPAV